jgi:hypothetical protein
MHLKTSNFIGLAIVDIRNYLSAFVSDEQFSHEASKQHYSFAHGVMPYIVENHFHDLVAKVIDESAQNWLFQVWCEDFEITGSNYSALVYPRCQFVRPVDEVGVVLISMPAPRVPPEAVYAAVVFNINEEQDPSQWLRYYFTLELGLGTSVNWIIGEWNDSAHMNLGEFENDLTVESFLDFVVSKGQERWR